MASEEDNFDIDIYGDENEEQTYKKEEDIKNEPQAEDDPSNPIEFDGHTSPTDQVDGAMDEAGEQPDQTGSDGTQKITSTDELSAGNVQLPKQAPQLQGVNRQEGSQDERYMEPGATAALLISELHWWITDDDIRGWANQRGCEDELDEITFNEHKVNGKSKGSVIQLQLYFFLQGSSADMRLLASSQAYVLLKSPQAATAIKQRIESFGEDQQYAKAFTAAFTNPYTNLFKAPPRDGPMRNNGASNTGRNFSGNTSGSGMSQSGGAYGNSSGGFRGGRGGFNNRGGGMNNSTGFNRGGFNQSGFSGFQGSGMGGFGNNSMGNMGPYSGFQNRGGMGGMRGQGMGGRGGRGNMMGAQFNGMGFGAMGMGMNMMAPNMGMPGKHTLGNVPVESVVSCIYTLDLVDTMLLLFHFPWLACSVSNLPPTTGQMLTFGSIRTRQFSWSPEPLRRRYVQPTAR